MYEDSKLLEKYDLRVPRYTSYPTAPYFEKTEKAVDIYENWISNLESEEAISLYIHIPFCAKMCNFCGCYTKIVARHTPVSNYIQSLLKEIELTAQTIGKNIKIGHIHWGGGSPTMMKPEEFSQIIDTVNKYFSFTENAELALELDPRTASLEYIKGLKNVGINRASIGIQDFDPQVQKEINRVQSFELTQKVINWLRDSDVDKINLDILYGLPYQDEKKIIDMIDKVALLSPSRLAFFGYAHVPWMKAHQRLINEDSLPDVQQRWQQLVIGHEKLEGLGYIPIGLDHFATKDDNLYQAFKDKKLSRNFQGYTTDNHKTMLGLGVSAIGFTKNGYMANAKSLSRYKDIIESPSFITERIYSYKNDDLLRQKVINELMCYLEVDLPKICQEFKVHDEYFSNELNKLEDMIMDDIVSIVDKKIIVKKRHFVRLVATKFDSYFQQQENRHSKAI